MKKLLIIIAFFGAAFGLPQTEYTLLSEKSHFEIKGTSTMHDWTMESSQARGAANIIFQNGMVSSIDRLRITLPAESLKSGKGPMDKNAYAALKTNKFPELKFDLTGIEQQVKKAGVTHIKSKGKLTIAGTTRTEELVVICKTNGKGEVSFEGSKNIKMSDYNVEAPSFMFGTVKTGDEITVSFNIQFVRNQTL